MANVRRAVVVLVAGLLAACAANLRAPTAPVLSRAEIDAIVASPDRSDADRRNDVRRKPAEMLAFIGVRPGMVVLDLVAGGGYTTELLARAAGPTGTVYGQSRPPPVASPAASAVAQADAASAPAPRRTTAMALAERARKPAAANIVSVVQPLENPAPIDRATDGLDLVTLMFNYHDLGYLPVDRARMNAAVFRALKPGGLYVVADHSGRPGTGISEASTLHRIEEAFLRREVEAAGFKLAAEATFLRNPADPRDREEPEPPMPKDEFVLRFVKP